MWSQLAGENNGDKRADIICVVSVGIDDHNSSANWIRCGTDGRMGWEELKKKMWKIISWYEKGRGSMFK